MHFIGNLYTDIQDIFIEMLTPCWEGQVGGGGWVSLVQTPEDVQESYEHSLFWLPFGYYAFIWSFYQC